MSTPTPEETFEELMNALGLDPVVAAQVCIDNIPFEQLPEILTYVQEILGEKHVED